MAGIIESNLPKTDYSWANQDTPEQIAKSQADRAAIAAWEKQSAATAPAQQTNTAGSFGAGGIVASAMAPAPAPRQVIDMLPWTPQTEAESAQKLWDARQANGWTSEQLGKEVGFTGPEIDAWFSRLGIGQKPGIVNAAQLGDPTKWNVTPEQTVEGRIASIIQDKNNPLQVISRNNAMEEANARGLVNSAMAVSAGEKAAYEAAMPIAQADAATFAKAAGYDADQANQFDVRNVDAENQFRLQGMANEQQSRMQKADAEQQSKIALINRETQTQLAKLDVESRAAADKIATDNRTLLETNSQAASAFNTAMSAINNVNLSQTMDADSKTQAVANVWRDLQTQLKVMGTVAGLDLTKTLNFAGYPGFDAQGNYVGFEDGPGAVTKGAAPAAPAPTPAPATQQQVDANYGY